MISFNTHDRSAGTSNDIPSQIQVQVLKAGWFKRSYRFTAGSETSGQLNFEKSYSNKAVANIQGKEFSIRRTGFWKHYLQVSSSTQKQYNLRIDLNWRNSMKVVDSSGNSYVFKSTGIWQSKWHWIDRYERPLVEIKSKSLSRKNRGLIEVKDPEMKDCLFWVIVSWFVIICSESDAATVAAGA